MYPVFKAVMISHVNAPVYIRELFALNKMQCRSLLRQMKNLGLQEAIVLSTCNRTEIYYLHETDFSKEIINLIGAEKNSVIKEDEKSFFRFLIDTKDTVAHLFEVSAGLDAQIPGDMQIIAQVKHAYEISVEENMTGTFLHRLLQSVFSASKRIGQETSFRSGGASVSYATTELIRNLIVQKREACIMVVGLGKMGKNVCRTLVDSGFTNIILVNRTLEKSESLARELSDRAGIRPAAMKDLYSFIDEADIIVSAAEADSPIITAKGLEENKIVTHKFFIDISVPRSIEEGIEKIPGVVLYNIDNISSKTSEAIKLRQESVDHVRLILSEAVDQFLDWSQDIRLSPVIHKIRDTLEQIRGGEINRFRNRVDSESIELIETVTRNMMQKIMRFPVLQLKTASLKEEQEHLMLVLNDLFDLEKKEEAGLLLRKH